MAGNEGDDFDLDLDLNLDAKDEPAEADAQPAEDVPLEAVVPEGASTPALPDARPTISARLYPVGDGNYFSLQDLLDYFTRHGSMRVSDLHLKVGQPPTFRVDGDLQPLKVAPVSQEVMAKFVRAVLSDIELEHFDQYRSVDASCKTGQSQYRVNVFRDNDGLAMAIRALENEAPPVEEIGFPNHVWHDIIKRQQGLVLMTGITGSGKSTTIASLITRILRERACRIITLEDPIEYRLQSDKGIISQREVGRDVISFERGLRDALREDPDVIFVGEMRRRRLRRWTLTAAETGHLVFSTLHTRDVRGTVTRVLDMFPSDQREEIAGQLSLSLSHIICQKLVPRSDGPGRIVAMEILNNTMAVANIIRQGKFEQLYSVLQTRVRDIPEERMVTLEQTLANHVRRGVINIEDAQHWANHFNEFVSAVRSTL